MRGPQHGILPKKNLLALLREALALPLTTAERARLSLWLTRAMGAIHPIDELEALKEAYYLVKLPKEAKRGRADKLVALLEKRDMAVRQRLAQADDRLGEMPASPSGQEYVRDRVWSLVCDTPVRGVDYDPYIVLMYLRVGGDIPMGLVKELRACWRNGWILSTPDPEGLAEATERVLAKLPDTPAGEDARRYMQGRLEITDLVVKLARVGILTGGYGLI